MRKDFGVKPWVYPQPVLIIGTYDADGKPDAIVFDPANAAYLRLGEKVGNAFSDGAKLIS